MPTYEYQCEKCGYKFEKFQKMNDKALKECSKCAKEIKRLIGAGMGVILKGKGLYATDYKDNNSSSRLVRRSLGEGGTCCGRTERCDKPPCSDDGVCKR